MNIFIFLDIYISFINFLLLVNHLETFVFRISLLLEYLYVYILLYICICIIVKHVLQQLCDKFVLIICHNLRF